MGDGSRAPPVWRRILVACLVFAVVALPGCLLPRTAADHLAGAGRLLRLGGVPAVALAAPLLAAVAAAGCGRLAGAARARRGRRRR